MSVTIYFNQIETESQLFNLIQLSNKNTLNYYLLLKNVNPNLITPSLIDKLIDEKKIMLFVYNPFFCCLKKVVKKYYSCKSDLMIVKSLGYLYEKLRIHIQDKYLDLIQKKIQDMKGKNCWADSLSRVLAETAVCYDTEMEKEIKELYQ